MKTDAYSHIKISYTDKSNEKFRRNVEIPTAIAKNSILYQIIFSKVLAKLKYISLLNALILKLKKVGCI